MGELRYKYSTKSTYKLPNSGAFSRGRSLTEGGVISGLVWVRLLCNATWSSRWPSATPEYQP